tara:strand:+ start:2426 stop:3328 length:903 start_codon:yes stop_codon:yes gene_type:complete
LRDHRVRSENRQRSIYGALIFCVVLSGCTAQAGQVRPLASSDPAGLNPAYTHKVAETTEELVPHLAEYRFSMTSSEVGSSVVGVRGALGYRFEKVCDGWITEMQHLMVLQGAEGGAINSAYSMTQWESFDGSQYRFRMRDYLDGVQVDEVVGDAVRKADKVLVTYEVPVEVTEELPADTMFPTQHTVTLLRRAMDGDKFANDLVFDGSGDTPTNRVAAVISAAKKSINTANDTDGIAKSPFHSLNLAYYPLGAAENGPSTEIAVDFGDNGVAHELRMNYGSFSVRGVLQKVTRIPAPECG